MESISSSNGSTFDHFSSSEPIITTPLYDFDIANQTAITYDIVSTTPTGSFTPLPLHLLEFRELFSSLDPDNPIASPSLNPPLAGLTPVFKTNQTNLPTQQPITPFPLSSAPEPTPTCATTPAISAVPEALTRVHSPGSSTVVPVTSTLTISAVPTAPIIIIEEKDLICPPVTVQSSLTSDSAAPKTTDNTTNTPSLIATLPLISQSSLTSQRSSVKFDNDKPILESTSSTMSQKPKKGPPNPNQNPNPNQKPKAKPKQTSAQHQSTEIDSSTQSNSEEEKQQTDQVENFYEPNIPPTMKKIPTQELALPFRLLSFNNSFPFYSDEIDYYNFLAHRHSNSDISLSLSEIFTPIQQLHYLWLKSKIDFRKIVHSPICNKLQEHLTGRSSSTDQTSRIEVDVPLSIANLSDEVLSQTYIPPDSVENLLEQGATPYTLFPVDEWNYLSSLSLHHSAASKYSLYFTPLSETQFSHYQYSVSKNYFNSHILAPAYLKHLSLQPSEFETSPTQSHLSSTPAVQIEPFIMAVPFSLAKLSTNILRKPYENAVTNLINKGLTPETFISTEEMIYYEELSAYRQRWKELTGRDVLTNIQHLHLKATASKIKYKTKIFIPAFAQHNQSETHETNTPEEQFYLSTSAHDFFPCLIKSEKLDSSPLKSLLQAPPSISKLTVAFLGLLYCTDLHKSKERNIKVTPQTFMQRDETTYFRQLSQHKLQCGPSIDSNVLNHTQNLHYHWLASKIFFNKIQFTPHYSKQLKTSQLTPSSDFDTDEDSIDADDSFQLDRADESGLFLAQVQEIWKQQITQPTTPPTTQTTEITPIQMEVPLSISQLPLEVLTRPYVPPFSAIDLTRQGIIPVTLFSVEEMDYMCSLQTQRSTPNQTFSRRSAAVLQYLHSKKTFIFRYFQPVYLLHCKTQAQSTPAIIEQLDATPSNKSTPTTEEPEPQPADLELLTNQQTPDEFFAELASLVFKSVPPVASLPLKLQIPVSNSNINISSQPESLLSQSAASLPSPLPSSLPSPLSKIELLQQQTTRAEDIEQHKLIQIALKSKPVDKQLKSKSESKQPQHKPVNDQLKPKPKPTPTQPIHTPQTQTAQPQPTSQPQQITSQDDSDFLDELTGFLFESASPLPLLQPKPKPSNVSPPKPLDSTQITNDCTLIPLAKQSKTKPADPLLQSKPVGKPSKPVDNQPQSKPVVKPSKSTPIDTKSQPKPKPKPLDDQSQPKSDTKPLKSTPIDKKSQSKPTESTKPAEPTKPTNPVKLSKSIKSKTNQSQQTSQHSLEQTPIVNCNIDAAFLAELEGLM